MNSGLVLYKRNGKMYAFSVAYEYREGMDLVGFDNKAMAYFIKKMSSEQKEWLTKNDPKKFDKTKNLFFVGDYYAGLMSFEFYPKGKPCTQLPGGCGVYKVTRKINNIYDFLRNETVIRALDKHGEFENGIKEIRNMIKEEVAKIFKKDKKVNFTAVSIEGDKDKEKINKIYDFLEEKNKVPKGLTRPIFSNGDLDFHMTIKLGELPLGFKRDLDRDVDLNVASIGISDDAVALGISGDYFSDNKFQHITLAFRKLPQQAKEIKDWFKLEKPFKITGIIRQFDKDKNVIPISEGNLIQQLQTGNFQHDAPAPASKGSSFPKIKDDIDENISNNDNYSLYKGMEPYQKRKEDFINSIKSFNDINDDKIVTKTFNKSYIC